MKHNFTSKVIREISAYDQGRKCRIWVGPFMKNTTAEEGRTLRGRWYCYATGHADVAYFVCRPLYSGCRISGINERTVIERSEHDVFTTTEPIKTKAQFAKLLNTCE